MQYERMKPAALRLRMAATNAPTRRLEVSRQSEETVDAVDNQDLFHQMDTDKSGSLSPEELREELRKQGDEPEDEPALVSVFTAMDADGDGAITYAEAEAHESSMVRLRAWLPASALVQTLGTERLPRPQSHPAKSPVLSYGCIWVLVCTCARPDAPHAVHSKDFFRQQTRC